MKHSIRTVFLTLLMLVGAVLIPACQETDLTSPSSPLGPASASRSSPLAPPSVNGSATPVPATATASVTPTHTLLPVVQTPVTPTAPLTPTLYTYRVVQPYPHDPQAFTQGLIHHDGQLYEGTGLHGRSSLRRVALETGEVLQIYNLPDQYFGEGITLYDGKIVQLTWQSEVGFVYDQESFELLQVFHYPTQGWGITHDGQRLIMSDGSATLYFWAPQTFQEIGQVQVHDRGQPVPRLNELEYIQGVVYANVWQTDRIAQIDPETGRVTGWIDLTGLLSLEDQSQADVLNGIAYDAENERLFVTGKLWPKLFEIELIPTE